MASDKEALRVSARCSTADKDRDACLKEQYKQYEGCLNTRLPSVSCTYRPLFRQIGSLTDVNYSNTALDVLRLRLGVLRFGCSMNSDTLFSKQVIETFHCFCSSSNILEQVFKKDYAVRNFFWFYLYILRSAFNRDSVCEATIRQTVNVIVGCRRRAAPLAARLIGRRLTEAATDDSSDFFRRKPTV